MQRYIDEGQVKFQIARCVLDDLDKRGAQGRRVQDQIVEAMLGLDGHRNKIDLQRRAAERQAKRIEELRQRFAEITIIADRQKRGYTLEPFLRDLADRRRLPPRRARFPRRARWRDLAPSASDLLAFAAKVEGKLQARSAS